MSGRCWLGMSLEAVWRPQAALFDSDILWTRGGRPRARLVWNDANEGSPALASTMLRSAGSRQRKRRRHSQPSAARMVCA